MGKKYFLLGIIVFHSVFTYAQNYDLDLRWKVIDTPVIFPDNFTDWIKRNIGEKYSGYNNLTNKPFGQIIQTDQSKHFIDFNKDGKKDIVLELKFRGYMSDSVLEARQQFYKGIFIAQPNGKYLLDTNFIITGRGYENGGEFGDFDGDGNLDYINIIANYHGKQEWKPLDLYKYGNNLSPSIVNMNNGKSFVQTELDVNPEFFSSSGVLVSDIDNDTNDEIILSVSEKFVIYKYNKSNKSFERKVLNLNNKLTQSYGRYITWISEPMIDKTHFISIISYNNNTSGIGVSDLAVIKIDLNQDNYEVLNILKQPSYTWPDGQFSVAGFHTGPFYKYYDLDNDGKDEFIMIGAPGRELNGSQFYAERMGINVFKNNNNVTANFYNIDTLDNLPKGYFGKLNNSIVIYPWSNGLNDVIKVDTATFNKYSFVYYRFDNGKFIRKKMIFDVKHNPLPYMDTWNLADDFNNDGLTDLFITHPDDLRNNKLLIPVYCNPPKPTFTTTKYDFCSGDSLKLTVSNINKSDSLKWYYGTKSDLTNPSNKTFTDSTKLFVTRTDSLGCVISSDTITITKNALPALPTVKDTVFCQNISSSTLLATGTSGNSITWYGTNATGGTGNASAVVAPTTDTTTKSYYVSQINNTTSCESPRAKITVKINPAPVSPSVKDTAYCNNISADTLKATSLTGHSLNWYGTSATGGTASALGSKPTTTTVGSFNYYVSQKNNSTGCEGARAKIGVTINPLPIAPVVRDTNYCNNASADTIRLNASTGATLLWYGTNATGGTGSSTAIKPSTATVGTANYYLSQIITATGCEGPRSKVVVTTKPIPGAPTLSRDTANFLLSGAPGTTWYKDGSAITDTAQKYKPTTAGSYTAKTTTNGCTSVMSAAYYYLVTDIINLSKDEFIKLAPNPFVNQLNFDFIVKGYQKLNIEVYDVATGSKVATQQNITAGTKIQLGQLARGTYIIRITSNDNKIAQQFKMVKL